MVGGGLRPAGYIMDEAWGWSNYRLSMTLAAALWVLAQETAEGRPVSEWSARVDVADRASDILGIREQCATRKAANSRWGCTKARMNATTEQRKDRSGCFFPACYMPINPRNLPTGVRRYRSLPGERDHQEEGT